MFFSDRPDQRLQEEEEVHPADENQALPEEGLHHDALSFPVAVAIAFVTVQTKRLESRRDALMKVHLAL